MWVFGCGLLHSEGERLGKIRIPGNLPALSVALRVSLYFCQGMPALMGPYLPHPVFRCHYMRRTSCLWSRLYVPILPDGHVLFV